MWTSATPPARFRLRLITFEKPKSAASSAKSEKRSSVDKRRGGDTAPYLHTEVTSNFEFRVSNFSSHASASHFFNTPALSFSALTNASRFFVLPFSVQSNS